MSRFFTAKELSDPIRAARDLLGAKIVRTMPDGTILSGRIVETEAYHQEDPASHTYRGQTERTKSMFGPAGHAYVYFTYGMHWCMNITCGPIGYGAAVLIRAVEPLEGLEAMQKLRNDAPTNQLTNGPAKFAQAFAIDKSLYGHDLTKPPLQLVKEKAISDEQVTIGTRIGISEAAEELLRFYITDSPFVSKR